MHSNAFVYFLEVAGYLSPLRSLLVLCYSDLWYIIAAFGSFTVAEIFTDKLLYWYYLELTSSPFLPSPPSREKKKITALSLSLSKLWIWVFNTDRWDYVYAKPSELSFIGLYQVSFLLPFEVCISCLASTAISWGRFDRCLFFTSLSQFSDFYY